jgi:hypothetical protein
MFADFWMNVQICWDIYFAQQDEITVLEIIWFLSPVAEQVS